MAMILESDAMRLKLSRLNPGLQELFLKYLRDMYDQESENMITLLGESRKDLYTDTFDPKLTEEQEVAAQKTKDMLENHRQREKQKSRASSSRTSSRTSSRNSSNGPVNGEVQNKLAVERYMRKREKSRISSSQGSRSSPDPQFSPAEYTEIKESYELETQEVLKLMTDADDRIYSERERQAERVRQMKEKKQVQKQAHHEMAQDILDKAGEAELAKQKDKARQEQKLKEKLEEMKKREPSGFGFTKILDDHLKEHEDGDVDADDDVNQFTKAEKDGKEEKKKKKKNKKKEEGTDINEETAKDDLSDSETKDKKKKKKKKEKNTDKDHEDMDDTKEKKKKKKKKKDKDEHEKADEEEALEQFAFA